MQFVVNSDIRYRLIALLWFQTYEKTSLYNVSSTVVPVYRSSTFSSCVGRKKVSSWSLLAFDRVL